MDRIDGVAFCPLPVWKVACVSGLYAARRIEHGAIYKPQCGGGRCNGIAGFEITIFPESSSVMLFHTVLLQRHGSAMMVV
jgi:hypothetical protein